MRKTTCLNWAYRLLTLLVVGLAAFSGGLFIARANNTPASCTLLGDSSGGTSLNLKGFTIKDSNKKTVTNPSLDCSGKKFSLPTSGKLTVNQAFDLLCNYVRDNIVESIYNQGKSQGDNVSQVVSTLHINGFKTLSQVAKALQGQGNGTALKDAEQSTLNSIVNASQDVLASDAANCTGDSSIPGGEIKLALQGYQNTKPSVTDLDKKFTEAFLTNCSGQGCTFRKLK